MHSHFPLNATIKFLCFSFFISISFCSFSQELTKKSSFKNGVTETYYVLKENKAIREGEYLRNSKDMMGNIFLHEYGQYKNNQKTGKWLGFYFGDANNPLKYAGYYSEGKKVGHWKEFYAVWGKSPNLIDILYPDKRTALKKTEKGVKGFNVLVDSSNQQVMSEGMYVDDKKSGVWNYYSSSGLKVQSFNHTTGTIVSIFYYEDDNDFMIFLGGKERFLSLYYTALIEQHDYYNLPETASVVYEIDQYGHFTYIRGTGPEIYKTRIDKVLASLPNEWEALKIGSTKRLQFISTITYNGETFMRYTNKEYFQVVD